MKKTVSIILIFLSTFCYSQNDVVKEKIKDLNDLYGRRKFQKVEILSKEILNNQYGTPTNEDKCNVLALYTSLLIWDDYENRNYKLGYDYILDLSDLWKNGMNDFPLKDSNIVKINDLIKDLEKKHPELINSKKETPSLLIKSTEANINSSSSPNESNKTVTLTVSGTGKTLEEAKLNALRSAIEQAFGAFISSKTEILNDNLVKDEIISVSNGNVQKYDIVSQVEIPNNGFAITLNAIVSISKLTSFVESKGVVSELKGNLFAFNVKNQILNEKNEEKSIFELVQIIKQLYDSSLEYKIMTRQPISVDNENINWKIRSDISVSFNNNIFSLSDYLINTLNSVNMTSSEVENYKSLNKKSFPISIASAKNKFSYINLRSIKSYNLILEMISYFDNSLYEFKISNGLDVKETLAEKQKSFFTNISRYETLDAREKIKVESYGEKVVSDYKKDENWYYSGISKVMIIPNNENFFYTEGFIPKSFDSRRYGSEGPFKENNNNNLYFTENINFNFLLKLISNMENKEVKVNYDNGINFEDINFKIYKPGLVISFIVFEQKLKYDFHFNDIKTLEEINKITEYKISKK